MSAPVSVAFYLPNLNGGGAERMSLTLALALIERGLDVTFVLNQATGELLSMVPTGVQVVSLNASRSLSALQPLRNFLKIAKPAVLLSSLGHNNIIALWARRLAQVDTRVIITQHSALSFESASMGNWQHRLLPLLYHYFASWADAVVAVSQGVADDLACTAKLPRNIINVIYNPVVLPDFAARAAQPLEHAWLNDASRPVFMALGRLVEQKDFATLLRAFALLNPQLQARLMILGEGPMRAPLQALAQQLGIFGQVELTGFIADPLPYLRCARALVLSSHYEGLGNVLIESLACGTPVISTDCPYGPREILQNGVFGELVPIGDHAAMAQAMTAVLQMRPSAERLQDAIGRFKVETVAQQYLNLFAQVLRNKPLAAL